MIVAVSPYHLTTREAPAMASLLLASQVVTLVPAPVDGSAESRQAAQRVPTYRKFIESWAWSVPLWKQGVIAGDLAGEDALGDMWAIVEHVQQTSDCLPLRTFMRQEFYPDESAYLGALAADLLKGGPDPGMSLPVVAGLDRFATRNNLLVARSRAVSLAQQHEARLGATLLSVAVPIFVQASADRILHAREVLEEPLDLLRAALSRTCRTAIAGAGQQSAPSRDRLQDVQDAAASLAHAYAQEREHLLHDAAEDEVRLVEGTATIACVRLAWDAALTSSVSAMRGMQGRSPSTARPPPGTTAHAVDPARPAMTPIVHDGVTGRSFVALLVRPMGAAMRQP